MGFTQVAVFSLLVTSMAVMGSYSIAGFMQMDKEIDRAQDVYFRRESAQQVSALDVYTPIHNFVLQTLTITVTNTGSATLDASGIEVFLDGEYRSGDIFSISVEGGVGDTWPPLTDATITMTSVSSSPATLVVAADNGVKGFWRI